MRIARRTFAAAGMAAVALWLTATTPVAHEPSRLVGGVRQHLAQRDETLGGLAARWGVEAATLAADNGLGADARLVIGQLLRIDNRHLVPPMRGAALVVNLPQRMVFHQRLDGEVTGYPIAIGRADWRTPRGAFTVVNKRLNPTWHVPPSILEESRRRGREQAPVVPPGPANPLGAHWIGLSLSGIGLHGTNAPTSIYRSASHGCLRLHPDDVAALFERVGVGDLGDSRYEPIMVAEVDGRTYLEVHRDVYRLLRQPPEDIARAAAAAAGLTWRIDWRAAGEVIAARHGVARDVTPR